jgi:hypothetical protein
MNVSESPHRMFDVVTRGRRYSTSSYALSTRRRLRISLTRSGATVGHVHVELRSRRVPGLARVVRIALHAHQHPRLAKALRREVADARTVKPDRARRVESRAVGASTSSTVTVSR